jgi:hypothetical protein
MPRLLSILLAAGALAVRAGTIASAGLVADGNGTRLVLRTGHEPLSRILTEADGTLRIEVQGERTVLQGRHPFPSNRWFSSVDASNSTREGTDISVFRFHPAPNARRASVLHREWDGREISFVLDKASAPAAVAEFWSVPLAPSDPVGVLASLSTAVSLEQVGAWGSGDMETVELRFSAPPSKAELSGFGKSYLIRLGKARLTRLSIPSTASQLVQGLAQGKDGEIRLTLKQEPRSILLTRSGSSVVVRLVSAVAATRSWAWRSGGKLETFGGSSLPSDESTNFASVRKDLKVQGGEGFTVEGSRSPTDVRGALNAGSSASNDKAALGEAQKLEAERRKSQEFSDRQNAETAARQQAQDEKDKVVYNTYGIRDPFIPLEPDDAEGGLNIDQMRVVGIIASPTHPMAVLEHTSQPGLSVALREGDAIQNGRVLKIERDRVVFLLEEFGVSRQFALKLQAPKGEKS